MSPPAEFDQFANNYDETLNEALAVSGEDKEFFARGRVEWLARCLEQRQHTARSVLDYGCGTGDTTALLRDILKCESAIGLDVSERALERAAQVHGALECRFLNFPDYTPDGTVDVVYCNGVFHHIPVQERDAAVQYIYRSLRPGGIFALWENNPWNPGTQYVMFRCEFDKDAVKISPPAANNLLRKGGFEIVRTDFRVFFPGFLKVLRSIEPALVGIPLGGQYQVLAQRPPI